MNQTASSTMENAIVYSVLSDNDLAVKIIEALRNARPAFWGTLILQDVQASDQKVTLDEIDDLTDQIKQLPYQVYNRYNVQRSNELAQLAKDLIIRAAKEGVEN